MKIFTAMKIALPALLASAVLFIGIASCHREDCPPPNDGTGTGSASTPPPCQPPPIEKNIIGTWHFDTDMNPEPVRRKGSITFTADMNIIDPDSLFENRLDAYVGPLISKTYGFKDGLLEIYQFGRTRTGDIRLAQTYPFKVKVNSCKRVELVIRVGGFGVILTQ